MLNLDTTPPPFWSGAPKTSWSTLAWIRAPAQAPIARAQTDCNCHDMKTVMTNVNDRVVSARMVKPLTMSFRLDRATEMDRKPLVKADIDKTQISGNRMGSS